jgi:disulfide bond formation protein DsbB
MNSIEPLLRPRAALSLLAVLSAIALSAALVSQYAFGFSPCAMCIVQRRWHGAVIAIGLAFGLRNRPRTGLVLQGIAIAGCLATSIFHTGVEQHWWEGTRECVGEITGGSSIADLTQQILTAPIVRCDEVRLAFAGLSMAAWDAILCGIMLIFATTALLRNR